MALKVRDTQTQVKHLILSKYLAEWAGVIINGLAKIAQYRLSQGLPVTTRLLYVDGFSFTGRYAGDASAIVRQEGPTWGSPLLGIQALDKARQFAQEMYQFPIETAAILVEDDAEDFQELLESLRLAGLSDRVVTNPSTITPLNGQILAIHGNFLKLVDAILRVAERPCTWSFFLLDPYGPKGIPYEMVKRVVAQQHVDAMINQPYQDLYKKQGILDSQKEKAVNEALLRNYDAMFGTQEWREVRQQVWQNTPEPERGVDLEAELTTFYQQRLRAADPSLAVKKIGLEFPDRERTMFYLFLTTHDPTGALLMNKVLSDAEQQEAQLKWQRQEATVVQKARQMGQMSLYDIGLDPAAPPSDTSPQRVVSIDQLANELFASFRGKTVTLKAIYLSQVDTRYFAEDIRKALRQLKQQKRVQYQELQIESLIRFMK